MNFGIGQIQDQLQIGIGPDPDLIVAGDEHFLFWHDVGHRTNESDLLWMFAEIGKIPDCNGIGKRAACGSIGCFDEFRAVIAVVFEFELIVKLLATFVGFAAEVCGLR